MPFLPDKETPPPSDFLTVLDTGKHTFFFVRKSEESRENLRGKLQILSLAGILLYRFLKSFVNLECVYFFGEIRVRRKGPSKFIERV